MCCRQLPHGCAGTVQCYQGVSDTRSQPTRSQPTRSQRSQHDPSRPSKRERDPLLADTKHQCLAPALLVATVYEPPIILVDMPQATQQPEQRGRAFAVPTQGDHPPGSSVCERTWS